MGGLLSSFDVLDLSEVGPASRASSILADYGADVVKVLRPLHLLDGTIEPQESAYGGGRGVRRIRIDLARDEGRQVVLQLADRADVVLESFRPGVARRLGIDASTMRARNPRLVHCAISGYGSTGPYAEWAGHDLNYVGLTGMLLHGDARDDGGPPVLGATVADGAGGGMHAVIAVLAALLAREQSGDGAELDVSATDGTLWLMSLVVDQHLAAGLHEGPMQLLTGRFGCYSTYRARDGKWLSVAALEPRFWANLCRALYLPDLVGAHTDEARQDDVKRRLAARFAERDRDDWVRVLGPADTCVAPVHPPSEVVDDPQLRARGVLPGAPAVSGQSPGRLAPLLAGANRCEVPSPAPDGEVVDAILTRAGIDIADVRALRAGGVVG